MGRRPLAGRDTKINQGHRRDAFFLKMRRKGGEPRVANQAGTATSAAVEEAATPADVADVDVDSNVEVADTEPEVAAAEDERKDVKAEAP